RRDVAGGQVERAVAGDIVATAASSTSRNYLILRARTDDRVVVATGVESDVMWRCQLRDVDRGAAAIIVDRDGVREQLRRTEITDRCHTVDAAMRVDDDLFNVAEFGNDIRVRYRAAGTVGVACNDDFRS